MDFLEAIAGPLAETLRAAADWLDQGDELPDEAEAEQPEPVWQMNDRGGLDRVTGNG
jgi:hypothetical protein